MDAEMSVNRSSSRLPDSIVPQWYKLFVLIWMAGVIVAAFCWAPPAAQFMSPSMARIVFFHVPCAMTAMVVSVASAVYALIYFNRRRETDDAKSLGMATLALLFWTLTTLTGAVFARVEWGVYWNWDPKQECVFVLLLVYLAYFALRLAIGDRSKQAIVCAGYSLFAAVIMPFLTYVLPNSVPSLHPNGILLKPGGMDATYHVITISSEIGFLALTVWIFRVQLAVDHLKRRGMARLLKAHRSLTPQLKS